MFPISSDPSLTSNYQQAVPSETALALASIDRFDMGEPTHAQVFHDAYDLRAWQDALKSYPRLHELLHAAEQQLSSAPHLLRDLFWGFYKAAPTLTDEVRSPIDHLHQQILAQVLQTPEFEEMRATGSMGDPVLSAMGTIGLAQHMLASLDAETMAQLNHLHAIQQEVQRLLNQATGLRELAVGVDASQAERLAELAAERVAQARTQASEMELSLQQIDQGAQAQARAIRHATRQGLQQTMHDIESMHAVSGAFGGEDALGERGRHMLSSDTMDLAQRVGHSEKLRQIAELCGQLKTFAHAVQQAKIAQTPEEVCGITQGQSIPHLLPAELVLLTEDALEDLFVKKWLEGHLLQYEMQARRLEGQGPIIIALDSSGSMEETMDDLSKEVWSKAVALALLSIARLQERDVAVIHFSNGITTYQFSQGRASVAELVACVEHFDGGGTHFEPWMRQALRLVDTAAFNRADVICISDGLTDISDALEHEWNQRRQERGMRVFGILLGAQEEMLAERDEHEDSPGASVFKRVTDVSIPLHHLTDQHAIEAVFAI